MKTILLWSTSFRIILQEREFLNKAAVLIIPFSMTANIDLKSAFKLSQLQALSFESRITVIEKVLELEGDINFAIPAESPYRVTKPHVIGYTALHFACEIGNIDLLVGLLNHGADFTKKNKQGDTALHLITRKNSFTKPVLDSFVTVLLTAHINSNNYSNPCDKNGFSHFHIACMKNNYTAAKFFLDNGVLIDECVNMDSEFSPGYTALHFAGMNINIEIAELLIAYGANMHVVNARSMTPLHLLMERKFQIYDSVFNALRNNLNDNYTKLQKQLEDIDKIINMFLENISTDNDSLDNIGLSNFHVACLLQDNTVAQHLVDCVTDLDHCLNIDSHLWPGYTALHFAAHVNIKTVEILVRNGANLAAQDAHGVTPLDLCMERYKMEDICEVLSLDSRFENLLFSDGATKLLSVIRAFRDAGEFTRFIQPRKDINMYLPMESPLWPGCTLLHLAVLRCDRYKQMYFEDTFISDYNLLQFCFKSGASLRLQDIKGQTALHFAFRRKTNLIAPILMHYRYIPNISDNENLSHLHIACSVNYANMLNRFIISKADANEKYKGTLAIHEVKPGFTPLHVCLVAREELKGKVRILLKAGADIHAKDANGLTPIHWLLPMGYTDPTKQLITKVKDECVIEEYGLSYLHVACAMNNMPAIKRLIKKGQNVNLSIKCTRQNGNDPPEFLSNYENWTPLHLTVLTFSCSELLMKRGADVFSKKADGSCLLNNVSFLQRFVSIVRQDAILQERMRREFGWTKIHLACYEFQEEGFEDLVKADLADINAQVFLNSPVWKGCTPLHILLTGYNKKVGTMTKILLDNGANVTLFDHERNTPVGILFKKFSISQEGLEQATLLIKCHQDFTINPVNTQGITHFHIACYLNEFDIVQGFLSHGVDVNHPIDYFGDWNPGSTPLHLASKLEVVNLLISHGGDIHIENVAGYNVLSRALWRSDFNENVVVKIIETGAEINAQNLEGQTPSEIAMRGKIDSNKLEFMVEKCFLVNSYNPISNIGFVTIVLEKDFEENSYFSNIGLTTYKKRYLIRLAETIMCKNSTSISGRTSLHHLVCSESPKISIEDFMILIEKLIQNGHDIDEQDGQGRTALHWASQFLNRTALISLLRSGADINLLDIHGKSAFSHTGLSSLKYHKRDSEIAFIKERLTAQVHQLITLNLDVNDVCKNDISGTTSYVQDYKWNNDFYKQVNATKEMELGVRSLSLYDFLSETRAILMYPLLNQLERIKVSQFFESIKDDVRVDKIANVLMLQYRKAVKRLELLFLATNSLRFMLNFDLPDLCTENIFQYLRNSELKNIIDAKYIYQDMKMDVN